MNFYQVEYSGDSKPECTDLSFGSYGWFPNVKLNFAENSYLKKGKDKKVALHFFHESGADIKFLRKASSLCGHLSK